MASYETKFALGDRIHIDNDQNILATVIGITIKDHAPQFEVSWFHNGAEHTIWASDWRLTLVAKD